MFLICKLHLFFEFLYLRISFLSSISLISFGTNPFTQSLVPSSNSLSWKESTAFIAALIPWSLSPLMPKLTKPYFPWTPSFSQVLITQLVISPQSLKRSLRFSSVQSVGMYLTQMFENNFLRESLGLGLYGIGRNPSGFSISKNF